MQRRHGLRIILGLAGVLLFAFLIWRADPAQLLTNVRQLGWGLLGLITLGGISHLIKTWAWRFTLSREHRDVSFFWMVGVRLAGEAVSQITFAGQLVGETTRALMMKSAVPAVTGVSSVVLDRILFTFTGFITVLCGAVLSVFLMPLPDTLARYNMLAVPVFVTVLLLFAWAIKRRTPLLSGALKPLASIRRFKAVVGSRQEGVRRVEAQIYDFCSSAGSSFWFSLGLNMIGQLISIAEVYWVLWLLGAEPTFITALLIESLTKLVNLLGFIIPGNLGAYEAGNMIILGALKMEATDGLTLGLARRFRGLCWTAAGLAILYLHGYKTRAPVTVEG